ncbi:MAG: chemotaxis protein CheX [Thermodesulfobacteriota bacterium]|nr:chemotaxis protein CheX [Thermodesulfobacteriota bacterium]
MNTIDVKDFVTNAIMDVFDTMLSMQMEPADLGSVKAEDGNRIVGSVSFAGKLMGSMNIHVSEQFARIMTAAMLGMELEEIESNEDIYDVIGELSNMVGGDLKSRFCDAGLTCELSIPSITKGTDFKIEPQDWARHECFAFRMKKDVALVEVYMKTDQT